MADGAALAAPSLRACFASAVKRLRGLTETPELDARLLTLAAFGLSHETFAAENDRASGAQGRARLESYLKRRARGEPVSRILGMREFYGRDFIVTAATLDPRPDTETLAEAAFSLMRRDGVAAPRILDLGTGTGCIAVTLLAERPDATGVGADRSEAALGAAQRNAVRHGVEKRVSFVCGDWLAPIAGRFDLIVANPPYIRSDDIAGLAPEVRDHDPHWALDGGFDGMDAYRRIAVDAANVLHPGGWIVFEVGQGQAEAVRALLADARLDADAAGMGWRDLGGVLRCVGARFLPKKDLELAG